MAPRAKLVAIHPIHGYAIKPPQDLKTIKRNERERNRVETVNRGFETLRMHVPTAAPVKKMSKVNILNGNTVRSHPFLGTRSSENAKNTKSVVPKP